MPLPQSKILQQYPSLWKSKGVLHSKALKNAVHYHRGTAGEGIGPFVDFGYVLDSRVGASTSHPNATFILNDYGVTGKLVKKPKYIRVLCDYGWWRPEQMPFNIGGVFDFVDYGYDPSWESIYFSSPTAFTGPHVENVINYPTELATALTPFCQQHNIGLTIGANQTFYGDYQGTTTSTVGSPITTNLGFPDTAYHPRFHPGRWLFHIIPRYIIADVVFDDPTISVGGSGLPDRGVFTLDTEKYIVGGDVLNIVLATDAYSAYHGCSSLTFNNTLPDLSTVGNRACMLEDIETVKRRSRYFKKWGCILVNSPKNPEFFPLWLQDSATTTNTFTPQAYALYDAQIHFQEVASLLAGYNFTLLMRPTILGASPSDRHTVYESVHLNFDGPQITIAQIMAEVHSFWGL